MIDEDKEDMRQFVGLLLMWVALNFPELIPDRLKERIWISFRNKEQ